MEHAASFTVAPDELAPVLARIEVIGLVVAWEVDVALESLTVVTTELVANAVRHGEPPVIVGLNTDERRLRLSVHDESARPPRPRSADPAAADGRGLAMVETAGAHWGCSVTPGDGKSVWAELPVKR